MKIVSSSSAAKSTVNIKWKKDSSVDGYEILVATDKKFSKNKNKYTIKSKNKATKKITNLKSGKKYYVKIRSYKIINKKKIYLFKRCNCPSRPFIIGTESIIFNTSLRYSISECSTL